MNSDLSQWNLTVVFSHLKDQIFSTIEMSRQFPRISRKRVFIAVWVFSRIISIPYGHDLGLRLSSNCAVKERSIGFSGEIYSSFKERFIEMSFQNLRHS